MGHGATVNSVHGSSLGFVVLHPLAPWPIHGRRVPSSTTLRRLFRGWGESSPLAASSSCKTSPIEMGNLGNIPDTELDWVSSTVAHLDAHQVENHKLIPRDIDLSWLDPKSRLATHHVATMRVCCGVKIWQNYAKTTWSYFS